MQDLHVIWSFPTFLMIVPLWAGYLGKKQLSPLAQPQPAATHALAPRKCQRQLLVWFSRQLTLRHLTPGWWRYPQRHDGSDTQEFTATYWTRIRSFKLFAFATTQRALIWPGSSFEGMVTQLYDHMFSLTNLFNLYVNCSSVQCAVLLCLYDFP